jgi:hypothetical protein
MFRPMQAKPYKAWNPAVVGAVLGIATAIMVYVGELSGRPFSPNMDFSTPAAGAGTAFGIGAVFALLRNWFNERKRRL